MADKQREAIEILTQELLDKLEVRAQVAASENDGAVLVTIDTDESGVLIGHHGRSLEAIQILLGQMVYKKLGEWLRIVVTVGDYRERRQKQLEDLAVSVAQKVVETQAPVELTDLTPYERRIVHMALSDHPEVYSESTGVGRDRKLTVKLRV